jgi:glycerol-3-phosphate dehydrogenase
MNRDLGQLSRDSFDVLVVGGGIHGLTAAYEAAQRGLRVALVERRDFGSGTSFNHHKTLHGGLRYLQTADIRRMRESIAERRAFARIAPQLISVQPFVTPTWPRLARSRMAMRLAFLADQAFGINRNSGVPESHQLPAGRVLSREEFLALVPDAHSLPVTGGALWYDYKADEGDRLTLAFGLAASRFGAVLANYADAVEPLRHGSRVAGMKVRDAVGGEFIDVRARVTVNAAGSGVARVMAAFGARPVFPLLKAMNVVTTREASGPAVALPTSEGRLLVALPWRGRLTVGTSHGPQLCGADDTVVRLPEVTAFLAEINSAFPWLALGTGDVSLVHRGVVPARLRERQPPALLDRAEVRDHAKDGISRVRSRSSASSTRLPACSRSARWTWWPRSWGRPSHGAARRNCRCSHRFGTRRTSLPALTKEARRSASRVSMGPPRHASSACTPNTRSSGGRWPRDRPSPARRCSKPSGTRWR